eukprot:m.437053 g.437053  ORF g.437053 m.437053 type:complete len:435 (-) comp18055_c0_seq1:607-1911(-)
MLMASGQEPPAGGTYPGAEQPNITPRRRKQLGSSSSFNPLTIEVVDEDEQATHHSPRSGAWTMSPHPRTSSSNSLMDPTPTPPKSFKSRESSPSNSEVRKNLARDFRSGLGVPSPRAWSDDDASSEASGSPRRWSGSKSESGTRACPLHSIASQLQSDFDTTVEEAAEAIQILAISADGESARDIVTAGIIEPLVTRVLSRADPEEELAALQNLGATQDNDDSVKSHMATVGVIPAVLRHVQPRNCNSSRLATAVVLNLAIESEERKTMLFENGACEALAKCLSVDDDEELQSTALNALTSLSIGSEQRKARIESTNITPTLLKLIHTPATSAESLSLIQSLVYCNDDRKRRILNAGLVKELTLVLVNPSAGRRATEAGSKLLKGIAGFAEHEATKTVTRAPEEDSGSLLGGFYAWAAEYVAPTPTGTPEKSRT